MNWVNEDAACTRRDLSVTNRAEAAGHAASAHA